MNGVKFDDTHSDALGMILTDVEIGTPEVKSSTIDIPCADGVLDLTEALTGEVYYGNRELKLTFETTAQYSKKGWAEFLTDVSAELHGQQKEIIFDDDPDWKYQGRCYVDDFESVRTKHKVIIRCDCAPYKIGVSDSTERSL